MSERVDPETGEVIKIETTILPRALPGKEIAKAILKAQLALVGKIEKDGNNKHLSSRYPTLGGILETIIPVLGEAGVMLTQIVRGWTNGVFLVDTILFHPESGEDWSTLFPVPIPQNATPQQLGSANAYSRRYGILTLLCLAGVEDDDGNAGSGRSERLGQTQAQGRSQQRGGQSRGQQQNAQQRQPQGQQGQQTGRLAETMSSKIAKMVDVAELDRAAGYIQGKSDDEISPADKTKLADQIKERKEQLVAAKSAA